MLSRTKSKIDPARIAALTQAAGLGEAKEIAPLGAGQYNAVYAVKAGEKEYVIKIAPEDATPVLGYEKDMMATELYWYRQLREQTRVPVPQVYAEDFTREQIPTNYFIMEKLPGQTLEKLRPKASQQNLRVIAEIAAQLHQVKGEGYGYLQLGLHANWYEAIRAMTQALLEDCARKGKRSRRGERLLRCIDQHQEVLRQAECCMVNFDLWTLNILARREGDALRYALIDPERSFWGDPIADFICMETWSPFAKRKASFAAYHQAGGTLIAPTREEEIRYAVAQAYLGLIMETEKYYRYSLGHLGWWLNIFACTVLYGRAFQVLGHD